ncbi:YDG domain-containing protein [Lachnospiraceae bacterium CLA-AA-H215]|uniref:YDG domain-containing protein n=1 Tax=Hominifimenecus microfluidus TaxID=2885348 RepID=A0AAE3ECA1_9FIRM|nr:YDG domain-containing protein [Hominifimenecus microfluidus]MCC2232229.1 YDG domain-containing protein [Hominifimenecus microfluidus]
MNTNMTLEKRILSVLLTVIMVFSMVPLSVFAADSNQASVTVNETVTEYATIQEAFDAAKKLTDPCTVKVLQSFKGSMVLGVTFTAEDNCDITLDVNGFDMYNRNTRDQASASMFTFEKGTNAHLTVVNNSENRETLGGIFYYPNGTDISNSVFHMEGGTLTIEDVGGDGIKNKTSNYDKISGSILYLDGGDVIINGSKFGEENNIVPLYVKSGNLTVNGGKFISQQGNALWIAEGFDGNVSLSGGRFSSTFTSSKMDEKGNFVQVYSIPSILREDGGKVDDLLAKGYVYQKNADDEKNSESALYREISVVPEPGVKYIAADGTEQSCTEYTELTESTDGSTGLNGWYVVKGTVNKEGLIGIAGGKTLNLILCEGATLNLQKTLYLMGGATLNIYGQNGGTGTLIVKGTAGVRQPGIGIMHNTTGGSASVNIYGGTVTAQTDNGAQPIGTNPELMPYGKVTVTIAKGLKCVKTDDQNTAYAYDNTDGTSITITKCTEHKWSYTNITNDTHDRTCDLCGIAETGVAHTTARYQYIRADIHRLICACGKGYSTEYHTYTYAPNSDGLTHTATCKCEYSVDDIAHTYKGEDEICICGAVHSATYDGKKYASLQSAIDAAAPVGGTVTLARQVNENVVSTDGTVTIDLGGKRWIGNIDNEKKYIPLTVNGGSVTLKNGELYQWRSSSSARTGIEINNGSVTIEEDVRVMGGMPEGDVVLCPSITLNGGTLILKEGAVLLSGLQVPEGKVLADYLPEGTAFVKCSYDNSSDTVTVSDPQEFVPDVYTANKITEGMVIVSHTHDFGGGTACPCGFNCDHSVVDSATGKCENCGTQIYVASLVKADGTVTNYEAFADAWDAAVDNEGSTLKLLCDITLDKAEDGIIAQSGKFTLDLNGKTVSGEITNQLLTVSGTADITIRNGKLINTFNIDRSVINLTCANALAIDGGTVTLDVVELTAGHGFEGARSYAAYIFSGNLTVVDTTFTGALAVGDIWGAHPSVKITSATLHNGIIYGYLGTTDFNYAGLKAVFADGSMLFDKDGKYIDVENEAYWQIDGEGEDAYVSFGYGEECVIKPHTHDTYVDGKCAECDYACPHDSGKNDREASYFQKAICSVCHAEYGDFVQDTVEPVGKIEIKERTWWQSFINTITFSLFYKEKVTVEITASDDSYSQAGYDETKHAVKIEYLISNTELSLETVKNSAFTEYKGEIDISDDSRYVVYARLNDFAGNEEYISTDGFVVDTTPPVIEVDADGQSKQYSNGQRAEVCGGAQIKFIDDNFDTAYRTIDGVKDKIWSSPFLVAASDTDRTERWITFEVHDKAGNISTVEVYVHKEHSFDEETGVCAYCGYQAAVLIKCSNDNNEEEFVSGGGLDETMRKVDENRFDRFYLKLYGNVEKMSGAGTYGSTSKKWTFDLNGYTISNPSSVDPDSVAALFYVAGDITFVGNGAMNADVMVDGGQLTIDGECSFQKLEHKRGTLTVNAGSFESLIISKLDVGWSYTRETALYGGHYGEVKIVDIEGLTCADLLARGYRFEGLTLEQAKVTELKDATIVACDHADIGSDGICPDCGMEFFLSVEASGTTKLFETFESAIRYAEQNDGSTVKLLQDITLCRENVGSLISNYYIYLKTGTYTLDLAGKALTIGDGAESLQGLSVTGGCNLTVTDTVGDGKIKSSRWGEIFEVRSGSHLTIERGDYTDLSKVSADGPDSLTIKGGKFNCVASKEGSDSVSPLTYLADGCAFMLSSGEYASEKDVESQYISGRGTTYWIKGVTVVSAPLIFHSQPRNKVYYLTTPNYEKWASFAVEYSGGYPPKGDITVTGEKTDGTVVYTNTVKPTRIFVDAINLWEFTTADSGQYRIKLEYNGYVLYSNTFTITMAVCEHPGYDEYNKCSQCGCDLAAAIVKDGKTTGYVTFAEALAAAQTDENKDCTLRLLANVKGTVDVDTGDFSIDLNGNIVGGLKVKKSAKVNVSGGTVSGGVTVAKTAQLTASNTYFTGAINCVGSGDFRDCIFMGAVSPKGGSSMKLNSCEINGELSVSGNAEADECIVSGTVTVNNGGSLKSAGGAYGNIVNVKSGGTLEIVSGTFDKKLTAESGSKLIVSGGSYAEVGAENNVDFTLSGGEFTNITVNGQHLIDCLAEGKAFEDMNNSFIIDGRVGIAGDVKVVDHTHTCIWKTSTHEKLCGCGYVETVDTEAPVISGIDPENNHYGSLEFTVTDANDFTVWMDDEEITLVNGKYTMEPDNETHLITATDVAGNTVSFRFGIFKTYHVTLPTGAGYTLFSSDELTVRHGNSFSFIVQFNNGYSKTEDFKVLVNGNKLDEWDSDANSASFAIRNVSENLVITVEGVADITAPEVEVSIRGNSFKEFLNRITFGLFFKQTQTVEVKAHDFGSGIKKVEYLLSETAFADKDAITGSWTELDLNDAFKAYFSIEPSQKTFVYVRVTDMSDNITVVNTDGMVVYTDAEAVTGAQTFTKTTDSDVVYKLNLNGNFVAKVYNGTEEIGAGSDYALLANGMLMLKNSYLRTLAAGEYTIRLTIKPMGENYADNSGNDAPADVVMKLTVEKKAPTLDHTPSDGKIYDGKPIGKPTLNTDSDGALTFEYKRADEEDTAYTTEAPKNVGKYTIRITTAETDTFKSASSTMEFEIQPKEVTISDVKVADKTYDGTTNATITNAGTLSVNYDGDNLAIVIGKAAYDNKNVGTDKAVSFTGFELSGSAAGNYKLITQPADTTADITAKEITINGATVEGSKVYDGTIEAKITNAGTLSDNYDGENLTIVTGSAAYDNKNVGTGKTVAFTGFALAGDAAGNYTLASQPADTAADITVKEITINGAAVEASRIYDGTTDAKITNAGAPSVNYDGENLKVAAGKAAYDNKNVGKGKAVTFTGFALEGDAAANYKLTAQPEAVTADITVKEIKIVDTAVEASKVYDGSTDAKITEKGTFDGLIDGDKVDIVTGKAAYDDKNVGNGKTVAFYEFALSGDDAANYVLAAQPASTTASISAKELTIADLKVKDKQYDGKNTAEIDGTPALVGVVDGDVLTLISGVPTFDSVKIGKNIAISFTAFTLSGDRVTVGNYTLTQPSGITANIVEYVADGSEYSVNSHDWINKDFVITAKEGYNLSLTDTANGVWVDSLTASDETGNGKLTFFVKNTETGIISAAVTENYKIDKTAPTGEVKLNERTAFQKFINTITFGLFFKDDVHVKLTATDEASGVKSVMYFKSDRILTDEEVRAITDWTDNSDFAIEAKDMDKFVIYVRIEDNAGNVTLIGSDGATFDTTAPEIVGVENDKTYYVTKKVAIDDENLASVTLNGETVEDVFTLVGDKDATYVIRAEDKAGNMTEYTVYMKPISSITDAIAAITDENVKSSDAETISAVERQILDIAEAFDDGESTDDEWNKLTEAAAKCKDLNKRIADVADEITRLTDAVTAYDIDKVTSADKADIEKLISDIDTLLDGDNLTESERAALEALKGTARALLDRIAAAKDAAEADEIKAVDGITKDNVKLENKEALEKAEKALEGALRDFDGNYTEEEQRDLEEKLETVKAALAAISNAEKAADEIGKLPSADNAKLSDKCALDQVKKLLDGLTENEKAMLGKDALGKVDALAEKIKKLAEEADPPKTGDTSNLALWIALLFISGGAVIGTTVVSKKQKHSAK